MYGGRLYVAPDQKIDVNAVMRNHIEVDAKQNILEGALAYRIKRKHVESTQDESKRIWFLVAWKGVHTKGLYVRALVIERNKKLNEDRLMDLYQKHWPSLKAQDDATKSNWTLNNMTMLTTKIKVTNRGYRWNIFIFEEKK
jgi:glutamate synthase domain-containing protein 3